MRRPAFAFVKKTISWLTAGLLLLALNAQTEPVVTVTADLQTVLCTNFLGFGVQWSAYPEFDLTGAEWNKVFARLDFMRVPMVRVMTSEGAYVRGFDGAGRSLYRWDSREMENLCRLLDYCERRHVTVMLGEWHHSPAKTNQAEADARWHRTIGDLLEHLTGERHYTCIRYYNFVNEPNSKKSGYANFGQWAAMAEGLHGEFAKRGLNNQISMVGPDVTFLPGDGYWLDLAARQTAADLGAYEFHFYIAPADLETGYLEKYCWLKRDFINRYDPQGRTKPFLMGEAGTATGGAIEPQGGPDSQRHVYEHIYGVWMADYNIQCARAGMAGTIAWDLDDAMHTVNPVESGRPDLRKARFKKWGFFNSLGSEIGHPEDTELRPWYFTWSLLARSFPPGCHPLGTGETGLPGLRTLAATAGKDFSVALVNDSDRPRELEVTVPGRAPIPELLRYDYFPDDRQTDGNGFPVPKLILRNADVAAGLNVNLPARSVVIFTTIK